MINVLQDIMKLVKQIQFCYSSNRRSQNPMQFFVTGVHGQTESRLQCIGDYQNWDVCMHVYKQCAIMLSYCIKIYLY